MLTLLVARVSGGGSRAHSDVRVRSIIIIFYLHARFSPVSNILLTRFIINSCTRSGELKIFKPHSNNNVRAHSFACRHVNCWNELPETTRNAKSLSSFKRFIAKFDFSNFLVNFQLCCIMYGLP